MGQVSSGEHQPRPEVKKIAKAISSTNPVRSCRAHRGDCCARLTRSLSCGGLCLGQLAR